MSILLDTTRADTKDAAVWRVGHYDLRRELGRGGMSVVYAARDTRTGQAVALKLLALPPTLDAAEADALIARFEREARTVARLSHPNIIGIHEIGVTDGQHFLAMEFLRGQTLRERLTQSRLPLREAYTALAQVAEALDTVHAAGIVHRDVKASNIMLLPDGTAKLLDFGIARSREEAEITSAGAVLGTPSYMAPEQVRGEPATAATDLWSLGVLSYEVLTGRLPFAGQVVANVLYQVMNSPPAPAPALPKSVQNVLRRALDKQPSSRYPSAGALVEALGAALPKSVFSKSPAPHSVAPKSDVEGRVRFLSVWPLPRWASGAALALLFFGAFSAAALHRRPVSARPASVTASAPPPAVVIPAPLPPVAAALPPPAVPPAAVLPRLPETRQVSEPPQIAVRREAQRSSEAVPPTPEPLQASERKASALPEPEIAAARPAVVHRMAERRPSPTPAPPTAAVRQTAVRPDPAPDTVQTQAAAQTQAAVQSVTLPAGGDDPEADARRRKSDWAQGTP